MGGDAPVDPRRWSESMRRGWVTSPDPLPLSYATLSSNVSTYPQKERLASRGLGIVLFKVCGRGGMEEEDIPNQAKGKPTSSLSKTNA